MGAEVEPKKPTIDYVLHIALPSMEKVAPRAVRNLTPLPTAAKRPGIEDFFDGNVEHGGKKRDDLALPLFHLVTRFEDLKLKWFHVSFSQVRLVELALFEAGKPGEILYEKGGDLRSSFIGNPNHLRRYLDARLERGKVAMVAIEPIPFASDDPDINRPIVRQRVLPEQNGVGLKQQRHHIDSRLEDFRLG
jgi:hypothetical protein